MTEKSAAEPLYELIRQVRSPATFRELMAACLRNIYMGDALTGDKQAIPKTPRLLRAHVSATEVTLAGVRCVIYAPRTRTSELPVMLYMHGGGFVIGCSEDTDYVTRMLCQMNQIVVVSVNYRLAPETVFPGALDDCEQVLDAVLTRCADFGIDSGCVYVAGDSAGATLAAALTARLQDSPLRSTQIEIKGAILLAPWLDMNVEAYDSYNRLAPTGIVFDAAFLGYARAAYVGFEQWTNPLVSPILLPLKSLPPTIVLIGSEDPFIDQALRLKQKAADIECGHIDVIAYQGMPHCFYSFPNLFEEEKDCHQRIAEFIRQTRMSLKSRLDSAG